jgi:hypothetical protein
MHLHVVFSIKHRENFAFTVITNMFDTVFRSFGITLSDFRSLAGIEALSKSMCSITHLSKGISCTKEADHIWVKILQYFITSENVRNVVTMMEMVVSFVSKHVPSLTL